MTHPLELADNPIALELRASADAAGEKWGIEAGEGGLLLKSVQILARGTRSHTWTRDVRQAFTVQTADIARAAIVELFTLDEHGDGLQPVDLTARILG